MRRPSDRRSYIAQPINVSSERHSRRRRSRDSRDHHVHSRRRSPKHDHYEARPVDMQICHGSDDEETRGIRHKTSDRDSYSGHSRKDVKRRGAPCEPFLPPDDDVRDGIVFEYLNYYEFLQCWLEECNRMLLRKNKRALPKRLSELITRTTPAEQTRIILPEGVFERSDLLHCNMFIEGLPPSVFFGSGFGHRSSLARAAAAKDLVDKCFQVGLISEALHTSIGNHPHFEKRDLPMRAYDLAVDAFVDLDAKLSSGRWPWDLNTAKELEPETLDRLKAVFNSVVQDIYFPRIHDRPRDEFMHPPMPPNGSAAANFAVNHDRSEFCGRCRLYGHSERYCSESRAHGRHWEEATSPGLMPGMRATNYEEQRFPKSEYDRRPAADKDTFHYTSDEIEQKIARQREELLRQEMSLRRAEAADNWSTGGAAFQPSLAQTHPSMALKPLMPPLGDRLNHGPAEPFINNIPPSADRLRLEQQLRASHEEELRAKLEAKAQKLEEEKRLRQIEEELERRMQRELEEKKRIMEDEIRRQVQFEERARLQLELARTQIEVPPPHAHTFSAFPAPSQFNSSYVPASFSSSLAPSSVLPDSDGVKCAAYTSAPDFEMEEIKHLIKEIEDKLVELQRNCREAELSSIFQSRAFRMIGELGNNAHLLDRNQKQMLLCELKELLSQAGSDAADHKRRERGRSRSRDRAAGQRDGRDRRHSSHRSRSRSSRTRDTYKHRRGESSLEEVKVQVGDITLRKLSLTEQRRLKVGELVVSQDMKTGKWITSRIAKVSGNRATLCVGNTTWKRNLDELFKEVREKSY
ncbi:hypothetical protein V3C99_015210 [Haemonchus contortus]